MGNLILNAFENMESVEKQETQPDSPIFKLNIDCLYNIFDYLSLEDVNSFARTCTSLELAAGEYFQLNFVTEARIVSPKCVVYPGIKHPDRSDLALSGFDKFIQRLIIEKESLGPLPRSCNKKLKGIKFLLCELSEVEIKMFQESIEHADSIIFHECRMNREFKAQFPKLCTNLKRLHWRCWSGHGNAWLMQKYPKLEHIQWSQSSGHFVSPPNIMDELSTFFKLNPQVQSFTADMESLCASKNTFIESHVKLNDLGIEISKKFRFYSPENFTKMFKVLEQLYEQGIYKRLHYYLHEFDLHILKNLAPAHAVKSLWLLCYENYDDVIDLPELKNLVELKVSTMCGIVNTNLLANQSKNLNRIHFELATLENLLDFLRHSKQLKMIKIRRLHDSNDCTVQSLDLSMLNEERKTLIGACKVAIYVSEEMYLATKWAMNGRTFELVEMRRATSEDIGNGCFMPWNAEEFECS